MYELLDPKHDFLFELVIEKEGYRSMHWFERYFRFIASRRSSLVGSYDGYDDGMVLTYMEYVEESKRMFKDTSFVCVEELNSMIRDVYYQMLEGFDWCDKYMDHLVLLEKQEGLVEKIVTSLYGVEDVDPVFYAANDSVFGFYDLLYEKFPMFIRYVACLFTIGNVLPVIEGVREFQYVDVFLFQLMHANWMWKYSKKELAACCLNGRLRKLYRKWSRSFRDSTEVSWSNFVSVNCLEPFMVNGIYWNGTFERLDVDLYDYEKSCIRLSHEDSYQVKPLWKNHIQYDLDSFSVVNQSVRGEDEIQEYLAAITRRIELRSELMVKLMNQY